MKNGENTDLINRNVQFWGPLKSQKRAKNAQQELIVMFKSIENLKHKVRKNKPVLQWFVEYDLLKRFKRK